MRRLRSQTSALDCGLDVVLKNSQATRNGDQGCNFERIEELRCSIFRPSTRFLVSCLDIDSSFLVLAAGLSAIYHGLIYPFRVRRVPSLRLALFCRESNMRLVWRGSESRCSTSRIFSTLVTTRNQSHGFPFSKVLIVFAVLRHFQFAWMGCKTFVSFQTSWNKLSGLCDSKWSKFQSSAKWKDRIIFFVCHQPYGSAFLLVRYGKYVWLSLHHCTRSAVYVDVCIFMTTHFSEASVFSYSRQLRACDVVIWNENCGVSVHV